MPSAASKSTTCTRAPFGPGSTCSYGISTRVVMIAPVASRTLGSCASIRYFLVEGSVATLGADICNLLTTAGTFGLRLGLRRRLRFPTLTAPTDARVANFLNIRQTGGKVHWHGRLVRRHGGAFRELASLCQLLGDGVAFPRHHADVPWRIHNHFSVLRQRHGNGGISLEQTLRLRK